MPPKWNIYSKQAKELATFRSHVFLLLQDKARIIQYIKCPVVTKNSSPLFYSLPQNL